MLNPIEYMADWLDLPYPNFIAFLNHIEADFSENPAILHRVGKQKEFTIWNFKKYACECKRIARGFIKAGLKKGDRVALWAENCPEWMAVWMASAISGCIVVPIDFLIGDDECRNILKLTEPKVIVFSEKKAPFAESLAANDINIETRVQINGNDDFLSFGLDAADQKLPEVSDLSENDPVSIVFTSGTTGLAKGVTLSHKGIIANVSAAVRMLRPDKKDTFISVLPLHHTYPTTCSFLAPHSCGIAAIIVERLVGEVVINDIRDGHGTFLIAVPLLYDKVMAGINAKYQKTPFPVRFVLDILRKKSLAEAKKGNPDWGRKVFRFIRKKAGLDSINIMVAGGGALNPKVADFFDSFGFNIVHGYGMSENGPLVSVSTPWHKNNVSVGLPVKYTDIKIVDKDDDLKILKSGEHGEILVKSPSLMLGYYKNPEATAEMFNAHGYLKTGDLGYQDDLGFVYISGRKKNLIVSAGGKNIYPEEIESHFNNSRIISEILVVGRKSSEGEFIFAIVFPNMVTLAKEYPGQALNAAFIRPLVKKEIGKVNRSLTSYKKIIDFTLRFEPFEKNAQQKVRRFIYKNYEDPEKTPNT
ncbi:long-chain-fatty-acid--CoA ligase [Spirochaetia bacterium]|nr:long-chain-fatty-acid--CoA ligase [Spirochaetia bacterium]